MKENLVIVESPTKAKTIQKFLGKNYHIVSSYGHIIDLPAKKMGVYIEKNFEPEYVILPKKKRLIKELKTLVKDYKVIWLASDEDREGEAIAYQIKKILFPCKKKYKRIVFHEITKKSILEAIKNPRQLDYNLIYAQQARRILDRLVGFQLSPILWKKIKSGLSAGRVQSVALRLIVEREEKIQNLNLHPNKIYKITGIFKKDNNILSTKFYKNIENENEVENIMYLCTKNKNFIIKDIIENYKENKPLPPFTTSTLQQESNNSLNFSIYKTMFLAQVLYEKGYITYMRTDSQKLSESIICEIKKYIKSSYGIGYLSINRFNSKKKFTQESHEAIRPTVIIHEKNYLKDLSLQEKNLYQLIWKRTIMSQMKNALFKEIKFHVKFFNNENKYEEENKIKYKNKDYIFIGTEKYIIFDGYMKIKNKNIKKNYEIKLQKGLLLNKQEIIAKQIYKNNLYRYNESSLVRNLENLGIGRPSTYVPIIYNIQKRNYVNLQKSITKIEYNKILSIKEEENIIFRKKEKVVKIEKNKFIPTEIGIIITNFLKKNFKEIIDYNFTANLEEKFDYIAKGDVSWIEILKNFYKNFNEKLIYVKKNVDKIYNKRFVGIDPKSKKKIFVILGKYGPVIQLGEFNKKEKPKFFPILNTQKINTISLEEILKIITLPKFIGLFKEKKIFLKINKHNIYIKYDNISIPIENKKFFKKSINLKEAIDYIKKKQQNN
ncbi:type I DNA topoisomerase [Blattabacterium cuenoti]|uniref:type I DNA topoisomerase n=1 Tax=Blattabacterium cuenoti TaxID=1653831 RepID=UPI00163CF630|nr:type I DNA topoisomerase [Blattabacterium cuenoti]